ncbi:GNAT family N-acetyltransferase [Alicyclobacillus sp. SO9]|uniref:GNAT family N-acetyltransferase n=1 Tax=Alicyclobacillus sp. SO9 TaxID=2665646 RepID=UPI0018E785C7|nr:hypothetical protein [Alicyclobacillus sp. SO9]QQE81025.1 hypothetical protein GI364_11970 [Alicyclobacillus sp. SO9]
MLQMSLRAQRLISLAERTLPDSRPNVVLPIDLFVGGLYERTGVLGELFLNADFDLSKLELQRHRQASDEDTVSMLPFNLPVSQKVVSLVRRADELRESYRQTVITEGDICSGLLELDEIVSLLEYSTTGMTKEEVLHTVCSPRDMVVHLRGFTEKDSRLGNTVIRRAQPADSKALFEFVSQEFGERWVKQVSYGLRQTTVPIFIAIDSRVRGFACYDVVRGKKGTFGPMGTSIESRQSGIGRALLLRSLAEMQKLGYDYAVIKNAGPIEFYEMTCGAVVVPKLHL